MPNGNQVTTIHDDELAGIDQLDVPIRSRIPTASRLWRATWPPVAAVGLFLLAWEGVVRSGWKPEYVLPGPGAVFSTLWEELSSGRLIDAAAVTMRRGAAGFAIALAIGMAVGLAVTRSAHLRTAIGSLITGLQTMPSIAWFPLAILLFGRTEQAIMFVVVLGAAPAIANGLITGVDHIPRLWLRAGRSMGARGLKTIRHVVLPAALPSFIGGLKQGWAFAWRSLLAGELLVIIAKRVALGTELHFARELLQPSRMLATMIVILVIGILVDILLFGRLEKALRARWGLIESR